MSSQEQDVMPGTRSLKITLLVPCSCVHVGLDFQVLYTIPYCKFGGSFDLVIREELTSSKFGDA